MSFNYNCPSQVRFSIALVLAVLAAGCAGGAEDSFASTSEELLGDALSGLSPVQQSEFSEGKTAFVDVETVLDGLGPVFNEKACGNCHSVGGIGGSGVQFEVRAGHLAGS